MQRPRVLSTLALAATSALLSACGGGGGAVQPATPSVIPGSMAMASQRGLSDATRSAPVSCTPILTVNPATQLNPTRTIRFVGVPNGENDEKEGEHEGGLRDIDAGGCDYGIYLGPTSKHARLRHARVHGATHIEVVAEGAEDFRIRDTAVSGAGGVPRVDGIWFAYGATGSVERSLVTDAFDGIVFNFNARGLVGETLIKNTSFLGINVLQSSNVVVEDVLIDNAMNLGGGVAIQYGSTGNPPQHQSDRLRPADGAPWAGGRVLLWKRYTVDGHDAQSHGDPHAAGLREPLRGRHQQRRRSHERRR